MNEIKGTLVYVHKPAASFEHKAESGPLRETIKDYEKFHSTMLTMLVLCYCSACCCCGWFNVLTVLSSSC